MEALLRELIAVNKEMLNELRMLRKSLGQDGAKGEGFVIEHPSAEPALGQPDAPKSHAPRFTPEDLEDIHGSLLEGLKKRNKDKSNAFSEFEKRHKNW